MTQLANRATGVITQTPANGLCYLHGLLLRDAGITLIHNSRRPDEGKILVRHESLTGSGELTFGLEGAVGSLDEIPGEGSTPAAVEDCLVFRSQAEQGLVVHVPDQKIRAFIAQILGEGRPA